MAAAALGGIAEFGIDGCCVLIGAAKEDLAIVLREQSAHTPEQLAKMHAAFSFDRFATTLGWGWNVAELSETRSLIERSH